MFWRKKKFVRSNDIPSTLEGMFAEIDSHGGDSYLHQYEDSFSANVKIEPHEDCRLEVHSSFGHKSREAALTEVIERLRSIVNV